MRKQRKKPKIWVLSVDKTMWDEGSFAVTVTKQQVKKLPDWVLEIGPAWYGLSNNKHVYTHIKAKDELEAMTRFYKLWAGLTSIEE